MPLYGGCDKSDDTRYQQLVFIDNSAKAYAVAVNLRIVIKDFINVKLIMVQI